jgi:hypothetical protein
MTKVSFDNCFGGAGYEVDAIRWVETIGFILLEPTFGEGLLSKKFIKFYVDTMRQFLENKDYYRVSEMGLSFSQLKANSSILDRDIEDGRPTRLATIEKLRYQLGTLSNVRFCFISADGSERPLGAEYSELINDLKKFFFESMRDKTNSIVDDREIQASINKFCEMI